MIQEICLKACLTLYCDTYDGAKKFSIAEFIRNAEK